MGAHLAGKWWGHPYERLDMFAPDGKGKPDELRTWAGGDENTPRRRKNMGCMWSMVHGLSHLGLSVFLPSDDRRDDRQGFPADRRLWTPILDEFDANGVKFALKSIPQRSPSTLYAKLLEVFDPRPTLASILIPVIWSGRASIPIFSSGNSRPNLSYPHEGCRRDTRW